MYDNIALKQVCATVSIVYYKFWVWICSLRYPGCNAHAPCNIYGQAGSTVFSHIIS